MNRIKAVLRQMNIRASVYFSGHFCERTEYSDHGECGYIHLLRSGSIIFQESNGYEHEIIEPTIIIVTKPSNHVISRKSPEDDTELICARLSFSGGPNNPILCSLPDFIIMSAADLPHNNFLNWIFAEILENSLASWLVLDCLFELLAIQVFRSTLAEEKFSSGLIAGLTDSRLSRTLSSIHEQPDRNWTVGALAEVAAMSRASFSAHFRRVIGLSPADYLLTWRVSLAQNHLKNGKSLTEVADTVGYESAPALARAFRRKIGLSPREWLRRSQT